ncbi:MAG: nucleoside triphosphate pyrophosphohydrolase [Actinomycetes bacterium]
MPDPMLVRDNVPEILAADGSTPQVRVLESDEDFRTALIAKLTTETHGLTEMVAGRRQGDVLSDLAEVLEVLRAIADLEGATWAQVEHAATSTRFHRGSFHDRVAVIDLTTPERDRDA